MLDFMKHLNQLHAINDKYSKKIVHDSRFLCIALQLSTYIDTLQPFLILPLPGLKGRHSF